MSDATLRAVPQGTVRRAAIGLVLLVPVATGGCIPRTLNTAQLERRLGGQLSERLGVDGIEVSCPLEIEVSEGGTFECVATAPGETEALRIDVTQVDDGGDVTWEIAGTAE